MRFLKLIILSVTLISCRKENIYYYSNNIQIKDSTVIRFVDEELEKLKIDIKEKNLQIYTILDSTSYKSNLDSIRNKIFEKSLEYNLKPKDRQAFDDWFREKIIVVDNKNGTVVNYHSSFKNLKYDRNGVNLSSLRKIIKLGSILNENPDAKVGNNNLINFHGQIIPQDSFKIKEKETTFLSTFNIKKLNKEGYFYNTISFLDAIKIFQALNNGTLTEPFVITKVLNKDKTTYNQNTKSKKILYKKSVDKVQQNLKYYKENSFGSLENELKNTQSLIRLGYNSDHFIIINDGRYTYLIYNSLAVVTNLKEEKFKEIPYNWMKTYGIRYYKVIRK